MAPQLIVIAILAATTLLLVDESVSVAEKQVCSKELERQDRLEDCQEYIRFRTQEFNIYRVHPSHDRPSDHHLHGCCEQLQNMEGQCRCHGLRMAVEEMLIEVEELEEVAQAARNMPSICMITPGRCVFSTPRWLNYKS